MGLREEKKQETREALFQKTMELFRDVGFDEARVQDVATSVRVSLKTFYNYFPTKEAVLDEYVMRVLDGAEMHLVEAAGDDARSTADRVGGLFLALAELIVADPAFVRTVFRHSSLFRAQGEMLRREKRIYELLADILQQGQENGDVRPDVDPLVAAESVMGVYYFTVGNWLHGWWPKSERLVDRLRAALDVVQSGYLTGNTARRSGRKR